MATLSTIERVQITLSASEPDSGERILHASDLPRLYWKVTCAPEGTAPWQVFVGVNQSDIAPSWLLSPLGILFVGVEQGIFALGFSSGELVASVQDASYVQSIEPGPSDTVLVAAEDQLLSFTQGGKVIWRINLPDVIEEVKDERGTLTVRDISGGVYRLLPMTGKPIA
jgi:hypothetical protein